MLGEQMSLFDAFRADVVSHPELPLDERANVWLLLGHVLERVARAAEEDRRVILAQVAATFGPAPFPDDGHRDAEFWLGDAELAEALDTAARGLGVAPLFERCLFLVGQGSASGASWTSVVMLHSLRAAFPRASHALHARALAEEARIAERLGFRLESSRLLLEADIVAGL